MPQIDFQKEVLYYLTVLISTVMTGIAYKICTRYSGDPYTWERRPLHKLLVRA